MSRSPVFECPARVSSVTGHVVMRTLQRTGAAGWAMVQAVLSVLWSAAVAPGGHSGSVCTAPARLWQE